MIAPAKLNLCLYLGPRRADGLHEICSLFAPISLADQLTVSESTNGGDEVVCPGVPSPDLTARALGALRQSGWERPPLRVEVDKRIPVAAGLGGGSADAAAVLRLAADDLDEDEAIEQIAAQLGADVPSQLHPRFALVGGAGEQVTGVPEPESFSVVLIVEREGLSTADVYAEADRLGIARSGHEVVRMRSMLLAATAGGSSPLAYGALLVNDLAPAAISLRPSIDGAIDALVEAGAAHAMVTGSGPTAFGLFSGNVEAEAAAEQLRAGGREAIVADSIAIAGWAGS
ncbi:MAG: 4-(cytidine 5'-diphospho)-2-C-methyl-D-erythritol kinase [Solirubrobacterales bacterium]|nr:4-(cytidine 5'-diphospho)-2-C-methyl-D-erythritol kinase [Solirubrobacterales bacterium]